jgi:hypothetical protein
MHIAEFLIVSCGESFEDTLYVVPVEHANWWEDQGGSMRGEGDAGAMTHWFVRSQRFYAINVDRTVKKAVDDIIVLRTQYE